MTPMPPKLAHQAAPIGAEQGVGLLFGVLVVQVRMGSPV